MHDTNIKVINIMIALFPFPWKTITFERKIVVNNNHQN